MKSHQGYQKVDTGLAAAATSASGGVVGDLEPVGASSKLLRGAESGEDIMDTAEGIGNLPSTHSSQQLMPQTDTSSVSTSVESNDPEKMDPPRHYQIPVTISRQEWFTVLVLCFVNLINYMDRLTIAGILPDIQGTFNKENSDGGLLQTVFVISYMVCAPIFGYLGDRHSRRWIMILGVALWSGTTLLGSYMQSWGWFMTFRALVGIGEASYSTIAPTIISDLFTHNVRSRMLACFYFAIPVGSGLGYIIGSETAKLMGDWRYALRVTPILGVLAVVLIYFCKEPERGENEGSGHMEVTSYSEDLKDICHNKSFMLSTLGFTCVAFVAGGLAWWGPTFMHLGIRLQPGNSEMELSTVSLIFGGITLLSGIIGVPLGSILSQKLKKRFPRSDPLICGAGLFFSCPLLMGAMLLISVNSCAAFILMFFGVLALNLNWAIVGDILLYVVVPTRRSTAEAFQILISHMFGDAGSPYLVGVISQALKVALGGSTLGTTESPFNDNGLQIFSQLSENSTDITTTTTTTTVAPPPSYEQIRVEFMSLQYALFTMCFVEVLGAIFFFWTSRYVLKDKRHVEQVIAESQMEITNTDSVDSTRSTSS